MTCNPTRTLAIRNRATGEVATVMDISVMTETELDKVWSGLARKVDFEKWEAVDSGPKSTTDDQVARWNAADPAIRRSIATIRETDYQSANT